MAPRGGGGAPPPAPRGGPPGGPPAAPPPAVPARPPAAPAAPAAAPAAAPEDPRLAPARAEVMATLDRLSAEPHLQGFRIQMDQAGSTERLIDDIYMLVPNALRIGVDVRSFQALNFSDGINAIRDLAQLTALQQALEFIADNCLMSRFDFDRIHPRNNALIADEENYKLYSLDEIEARLGRSSAEIVRQLGIADMNTLPDIGESIYGNLTEILINLGLVNFASGNLMRRELADILLANLIALEDALDPASGLLQIQNRGASVVVDFQAGQNMVIYRLVDDGAGREILRSENYS